MSKINELVDRNMHEGMVIARFGKYALIETELGIHKRCAIRAHLKTIVVGDHILWQEVDKEQGVIVQCCARNMLLMRYDDRGKQKPLAANLTHLFVVVAKHPHINWLLLDSYLVAAEQLGLPTSIILNKMDLQPNELLHTLTTIYAPLGYAILTLSQNNPDSQVIFANALQDKVSVLVGQSGVGKSSILQQFFPDEPIVTAALSTSSALGAHTTSVSRLYRLASGGAIIDSPGIREFQLGALSAQKILYGFREMHKFAAACKYRNCSHSNTPGCELIKQVQQGVVAQERYQRMLSLLARSI